MEFCKQFNARTGQKELEGLIIPVVVTVYSDRSFTFITRRLRCDFAEARRRDRQRLGCAEQGQIGKVTLKQVEDIARQKMPDLNAASVAAAIKSVSGTARSMGIDVVG